MGTHISRVKSADLDAWTDEQTQMMVKWGNRRANKYLSLVPPLNTVAPVFGFIYLCLCALYADDG
jgi:Putative GTPase activating protein for Arf